MTRTDQTPPAHYTYKALEIWADGRWFVCEFGPSGKFLGTVGRAHESWAAAEAICVAFNANPAA